jgi:hypothetical protein
MSSHVLLNNVDHKDLRIVTKRSADYGDEVMLALTFPAEFRNLQVDYPIVFRHTADGVNFEPVALFGFQEGENLFLGADGWDATEMPLAVGRLPFLIGKSGDALMVHVDLASPRISATDGEPVFLPHGGNTGYLERINSYLFALHEGIQSTPAFITALLEHDLLESFFLDITLDDGSQNRLAGFYTIHEERLNALDGAVLERLQKAGYLQAIYFALASLSNFRVLIERKNRRNAGQP